MQSINLSVAILAGGLATRLRPLTATIPKSLIMIHGEPFIAHQLRLLKNHGITEVVMCVGFLGDLIVAAIGDGSQFGLKVQYSFETEHLLGTGGALKAALPMLGETFLVLYGDSYLPCNYQSIYTAFKLDNKQALMTILQNRGQWDVSNVEYTQNKILAYEKHQHTLAMQHIDYGLGVFCKTAFTNVPDNVHYDLTALYQELLRQNQLAAFEVFERFYEIGSFSGIKETEAYLNIP